MSKLPRIEWLCWTGITVIIISLAAQVFMFPMEYRQLMHYRVDGIVGGLINVNNKLFKVGPKLDEVIEKIDILNANVKKLKKETCNAEEERSRCN